jgi:hypothetical protein
MFSCPNCAQVLGDYPDGGILVVVCARCTFRYEVTGGVVAAMESHRVEVTPSSREVRARYMRRFELSVATTPRETLRFRFETDRDDDWIRMSNGHRCAVVFSMRGAVRDDLLFVVDRTTSERFVLAKAGQRSRKIAIASGTMVAAGIAVAGIAAAIPLLAVGGFAVVAGVGAFALLRRVTTPGQAISAIERETLTARQALLGQKRTLLRSRDSVIVDIDARRAMRQRLELLRLRMVAVRLDAYADRIRSIDAALATLDEQLALDARLADEYDRAIQILEIEFESSLAADALPMDSGRIMDARLEELRGVEELRAETTRRLAANAEVERLLRTNTD